jgi:hypothetical protein
MRWRKMDDWIFWFLGVFCPDHLHEEIEGDLIQKYNRDVKTLGSDWQREDCFGIRYGFLEAGSY